MTGDKMPFLYSIEKDKKDSHEFIMITGYEGNIRDLVVPEEIDGIRVEAIGNHSFSARQDIMSVTLPRTIRTLYGFAFHNCRKLRKITLFDSIDDYYDGVCRQCDSLSDIEITVDRGWFEVIRNFLADSDRTLRFEIKVKKTVEDAEDKLLQPEAIAKETDGELADSGYQEEGRAQYEISSLTFPEYVYDFNENTMARTIQFSIAGSGMFYRECVDRRSINYREYDRLFDKARIDGGRTAEDIAIGRVLHPAELRSEDREMYEDYIRMSSGSILKRLIDESAEDPENIGTLKALLSCDEKLFDDESIDGALRSATEKKYTEICAILMDRQRSAGTKADNMAMTFEL